MASALLLGPLVGYEGPGRYTICAVIREGTASADVTVTASSGQVSVGGEAELPSGDRFVRFDLAIDASASHIAYSIRLPDSDAIEYTFHVPQGEPRLAFASCNGFTKKDHLKREKNEKDDSGWGQWRSLNEDHASQPFHLLILGGDQIYTDAILHGYAVAEFGEWLDMRHRKRMKKAFTQTMRRQLNRFYENEYVRQWSQADVRTALATIPSVMMWDDHDIIDGWGSYEKLHESPVFKGLFSVAEKFFRIFQLRLHDKNRSVLGSESGSWGLRIGTHAVLGLDNRTHRTTKRVMSDPQWKRADKWLDKELAKHRAQGVENLLVVSAVPVVYRRFGIAEFLMNSTEWIRKEDNPNSLEDDVRDHWQHPCHQKERAKLIMTLLDTARRHGLRTAILSGDVHVGCVGTIDHRNGTRVHQLVSSGILHPPPTSMEWAGILATSSPGTSTLDGGDVQMSLCKPEGTYDKYLRSRNYLTLQVRGNTPKLYAEWKCESGDHASHVIC